MLRLSRKALSVKAVSSGTAGGRKTASGRTASGAAAPAYSPAQEYLRTLPGISDPFKNMFDPANLAASAKVEDVRRWRESEITHGRVAMLAALGFIVGEQLEDFPAFFNFDGHIEGPAITHFNQVQQGFWEPLLIAIGLAESYRVNVGWATPTGKGFNSLKDDYEMGDLGFDPLGLKPEDPAELKEMKTKELNNGRLAMIAIAGFVLQEVAKPDVEIFEHLFYGIEKAAVMELDAIEKDLGLPLTPVPELKTRLYQ